MDTIADTKGPMVGQEKNCFSLALSFMQMHKGPSLIPFSFFFSRPSVEKEKRKYTGREPTRLLSQGEREGDGEEKETKGMVTWVGSAPCRSLGH
jgi:hypothetical protein